MAINLYQQCGHNTKWNVEALTIDKSSDGLILSPVHYKKHEVENLEDIVRKTSLFDPQFYLPNSQKSKIRTYPFFPDVIANGFSTANFELHALEAAKKCVKFQLENEFQAVIIPARFFDQLDPDYCQKQEVYSVLPFLEALAEHKNRKPVFLTLPVTRHMIANVSYRTELLNWVTKFPEISGVYLICGGDLTAKQVTDENFLLEYLRFISALIRAEMDVIVGYLNTESILFTVFDSISISMGTFENTRIFSLDKFVVTDEERRGPKARIFLPGLLNWVEFGQARFLKQNYPDIWARIHVETPFSAAVLAAEAEPTFNQPPLYRHHFQVFSQLIGEIAKITNSAQRISKIRLLIETAIASYEMIESVPYSLEKHGANNHLQQWLNVLNTFTRGSS